MKMPVRCPNQLSCEAIDVGSRSVVGSYVPVIKEGEWFMVFLAAFYISYSLYRSPELVQYF